MDAVLGIDIAKASLATALLFPDGTLRHKTWPNTPTGFTQLAGWLTRHGVSRVHAALEATGTYGEAVATFLYDAGHTVSVLNPAVIRAYAGSQLTRSKTDQIDATLIARFVATHPPPAWTPLPVELRALQALVRRLDALQDMHAQEANRRAAGPTSADVARSIDTMLASLAAEIAHVQTLLRAHLDQHPDLRTRRDLLISIPGIGEATATRLLAELFHVRFTTASQAAAFAGLVPRLVRSGTLRGRTRLSKVGPSRLRKALYFPALTALRCNPSVQALRARLRAAGKCPMVIVGAAMRKLIHLAFGVLKSGRAYDPAWRSA